MTELANGEQYVKYTTKELLREIALKVDRIEERFDQALVRADDDIRHISDRLLRVETNRESLIPQFAEVVRKVNDHERQLNEITGQSKWKQWALPLFLTVMALILTGLSIWVTAHTGFTPHT